MCAEIQKHQSPLASQIQAAENLHLIADVVKIIPRKSRLAWHPRALDLVPECETSFYRNTYKAVTCKLKFLQERVFSR